MTVKVVVVNRPPASVTRRVIVAVPDFRRAGVMFNLRFAPDPPSTNPVAGSKLGSDEVTVTVRAFADVSASPTVKLIVPLVPL